MLVGYARVSTDEQHLELQIDAFIEAGCERIFQDKLSGSIIERRELLQALQFARAGDTLVVWRLDRLSRSLRDLIDTVTKLESRGIQLKSLHESIDTSSNSGKLIFHLFGALAEFERNLIKERTLAGLHAARTRGRKGGRPPSQVSEKRKLVVKLYLERNYSVSQICQMMGISKPTMYKYVKASRAKSYLRRFSQNFTGVPQNWIHVGTT